MLFGGGEFLMEAMEVITDEPAFDAAWLDFCKYYNASNAEYVSLYYQRLVNSTPTVKWRNMD